ncbi:tonB-dependent Receptor Plug domain protein [Bacteroides fragilis str. S36L12]|nr:tonB-dependent Receptor Plug domain protein [Bacteroides fragilis str. S36L12]
MVKDDHGVFSGYLSLGDTLRSGNYTLRFYTRYLSSLPAPRYFYRQIIVGGRPFQDYRKESVTRMAASYHVSFFPEGGRLPSGCVSRIAFKALSPDGLGTDVQGFVVNQRGDTVTTLRSVHRGMGFFNLEPVSGDSYTAVCRNREGMELRFPLPPADPSAVSLRVDVRKDDFLVRLNSGVSLSPGHSLRVEYRDSILLHAAFSGSRPLRLLRSPLPPGVLRFVLLDGSGVPISGRTAFNQSPSVRADVDFSARLKEEKGRSFWDVSLGLRDSSGEPLGGTLSVSVTDDRYALQDTTVNILSSFLLSSDLQGYVEAPSFYFSSDDSRTSYLLDLLMLTQGWVKYSLVPDRGSFPVERSQCVSGKVVSEYSEKKCIADAVVTLFSFDKKIMRQTTSDASGCFRFDSLSFPRGTHFILQARKKKGGTDVALLVDRDSVPSVHSSLPVYADWFRAEMDEPVVSEQSGNDPSPTSANVFQRSSTAPFSMEQYLDEVVVSTKKIEKKKRYAIESLMAHSDWNKTYHVDEMTLSPYSSTKDLLINTPGVGWAVDSNSGDFFYITRLRAGGSSTPPPALLMVDGLETSYSELVGIPVSIVESIELVKDAAQMAYIGSKASNGAILISTKSGLGTVGKKASNFRIIRPIGYQVKRESYSPSYPVVYGAINNGGNSFRTIYWSPDLLLDKAASHLEFGNPKQGRLTLVVQGITPDGKLINLTRTLGNE